MCTVRCLKRRSLTSSPVVLVLWQTKSGISILSNSISSSMFPLFTVHLVNNYLFQAGGFTDVLFSIPTTLNDVSLGSLIMDPHDYYSQCRYKNPYFSPLPHPKQLYLQPKRTSHISSVSVTVFSGISSLVWQAEVDRVIIKLSFFWGSLPKPTWTCPVTGVISFSLLLPQRFDTEVESRLSRVSRSCR